MIPPFQLTGTIGNISIIIITPNPYSSNSSPSLIGSTSSNSPPAAGNRDEDRRADAQANLLAAAGPLGKPR
jgi:hypothetical protein